MTKFTEVGSKLKVEIQDDGSVKINATGMIGDEADLLAELEALARECGGELEVEKHIEGAHHHHHGGASHHHKAGHKK